jgi:hypothetical protein
VPVPAGRQVAVRRPAPARSCRGRAACFGRPRAAPECPAGLRGMRPRPRLEHHRRQLQLLDRRTGRHPLGGQLLQGRRHEHPQPLIRRGAAIRVPTGALSVAAGNEPVTGSDPKCPVTRQAAANGDPCWPVWFERVGSGGFGVDDGGFAVGDWDGLAGGRLELSGEVAGPVHFVDRDSLWSAPRSRRDRLSLNLRNRFGTCLLPLDARH